MFSSKTMTPIDRDLSKKVVKIIHALLDMDQSAPFRKPVPHKALGLEDYKQIVKKPMDLNLIRRQNNEGKYKTIEEILDDIQLCWDNCKIYNSIESQIYGQSLLMENAFDKYGVEYLPQFWQGVDRNQLNRLNEERKREEERVKKVEQKLASTKKEKIVQNFPPQKAKKASTQKLPEPQLSQMMEEQLPKKIQLQQQKQQKSQSQEQPQQIIEPIMVNLYKKPKKEHLQSLSNKMSNIYLNEDFQTLNKVLELLHNQQKQHMIVNRNGEISFNMQEIHLSTYMRINKIINAQSEELPIIIE